MCLTSGFDQVCPLYILPCLSLGNLTFCKHSSFLQSFYNVCCCEPPQGCFSTYCYKLKIDHVRQILTASLLFLLGYFISPIVLRHLVVDKEGNRLPSGPLTRYACLRNLPERTLDTWAKQYGKLFSIWMGSQLFVVVSDPRMARDLLVTNGAIFSSRKKYFIKNQVILRARAITATEYGSKW